MRTFEVDDTVIVWGCPSDLCHGPMPYLINKIGKVKSLSNNHPYDDYLDRALVVFEDIRWNTWISFFYLRKILVD